MVKEIKCIVSGLVQMVMFRDFTRRNARGLNIVGTVENLPDGTVRVIAQGQEPDLEQFIKKLRKGSILSHVKDVHITEQKTLNNYSDFDILY